MNKLTALNLDGTTLKKRIIDKMFFKRIFDDG